MSENADLEALICSKAYEFHNKYRNVEVEDLKQEARYIVTKLKASYNPTKGLFTTYCYACISNHLSNFCQKQNRKETNCEEDVLISIESEDEGNWIEQEEEQTKVKYALLSLSDLAQQVILGKYFQNETLTTLSKRLNYSVEGIRMIELKALKKLKFILKGV